MNFLDRAIAVFAPNAGLRRALAREAITALRSYDGAMVGRRTAGWHATGASANAAIRGPLPRLRNRSRDLSRNTWWGPRVKHVFVGHAIGTGIMPVFQTGNRALDKRAAAAWRKWGKHCDAEGQLSFAGLQALATGCIIESGEVLARKKVNRTVPSGVVPLEVQLLEPDHIDVSRDRLIGQAAGRAVAIVDQGIEYDADGKRVAYWLLPEHPGSNGVVGRGGSVRVPATDVLHVYRKDRIGQGRGVPWLAPIMLKGRDVADLEESIIVKSRVEACLGAFVRTTDTSRTLAAKAVTEQRADGTRRRVEQLSPGMIHYLEPGEEVSTIAPSSSVAFEHVLMANWLALAAGAGITYDQLTGDLRQANYSSLRAGKIEFRRIVEQFQWLTLVDTFLEPIADAWAEMAQDFGILPRRASGYPREWIMPAVEPIDPLKDLQADILAVRAGRMTWAQFVSAWGFEPQSQLDEIEQWLKELDRRGIVLDADPRRALSGVKGAPKSDAESGDAANAAGQSKPDA